MEDKTVSMLTPSSLFERYRADSFCNWYDNGLSILPKAIKGVEKL